MDKEFLNTIKIRPGMYFPCELEGSGLFHGLVSFISGYEYAKGVGSLVAKDFHSFVGLEFGVKNIGSKGWSTFIGENTDSELEAFNKFFELVAKYESSATNA